MKIEGSSDIAAPRERVWAAFLDPAALARAIPGCEQLEEIGPGEYRATMKVGVAAIKGTFQGKVRLSDLEPPTRGSGSPGFVRGDAAMELSDAEGGTRVSYSADVQVGGLIASVGERMLGGGVEAGPRSVLRPHERAAHRGDVRGVASSSTRGPCIARTSRRQRWRWWAAPLDDQVVRERSSPRPGRGGRISSGDRPMPRAPRARPAGRSGRYAVVQQGPWSDPSLRR